MSEDLPALRSLLGTTAALWAGAGLSVHDDRWSAISGTRSVDYNVVVCHGGAGSLAAGVAELTAAGVPGLVMVAGEALGAVQSLVADGWVCIGSAPFLRLALDPAHPPEPTLARRPPPPTGAKRLAKAALPAARALVREAFDIAHEAACVALPATIGAHPDQTLWGLQDADGRLVSCLAAATASDVVGIWSMATARDARGRGYGSALLAGALAQSARAGARSCLLYSSDAGEPLYRALGFEPLERWQLWSRPRWILGRA